LVIQTSGSSSIITTAGIDRGRFTISCTVTDDQDRAATTTVLVAIIAPTTSSRGASTVAPPLTPTPSQPQAEALQVFHARRIPSSGPPVAVSRSPASVPEEPANAQAASPSDADAAFLKWHQSLPFGQIQDNIGTFPAMRLGVPYTVTVTIAGEKAAPLPTAPGTSQSALQVSSKMRVLLTNGVGQANGFTIVDADPVENPKPLAPDGTTQWNWTVTPNRLGNLQLHIAAFVLKDDTDPIGYSYESYDRNVDVKSVTLWGYLTNGLLYVLQHPAATLKYWLPGGGGAAILAGLLAWWKKRKAGATRT
jgi:hypothetical protein